MADQFRVNVYTEIPQLIHFLDQSVRKQLPFATAVSLTRLARESRDEIRSDMTNRFTLRSTRVPKGIQFNRAEKKDWPHSFAEVGSKDEFMVKQEVGGIKKPESGTNIAIPTRIVKRGRSGKIPKRLLPRAIGNRKGSAKTADAIMRKRTKRSPLGIMYLLRHTVKIDKRLGMQETTTKVVSSRYSAIFAKELQAAMNSQKRKSKITSGGGRQAYLRARGKLGAV